jgi:hypothetical protein
MQLRILSNMFFGLSIGCAALLRACAVPEDLAWLAIGVTAAAMVLTNLMWIRSIGLAGIGGLSIVFVSLAGRTVPGAVVTFFAAVLLTLAVLLAIFADFSGSKKGKLS